MTKSQKSVLFILANKIFGQQRLKDRKVAFAKAKELLKENEGKIDVITFTTKKYPEGTTRVIYNGSIYDKYEHKGSSRKRALGQLLFVDMAKLGAGNNYFIISTYQKNILSRSNAA